MKDKINIPFFGEEEQEIVSVIKRIKEIGKTCHLLKKNYPSVWKALHSQYKLDLFSKKISESLFDKKLEVMLLEDEELRER